MDGSAFAVVAQLVVAEAERGAGISGHLEPLPGAIAADDAFQERYLRAAVVTTIYGGTSEIQRNIIAKTLGL